MDYDKANQNSKVWNPLGSIIKPGDYVLIKPLQQEAVTPSGIVLPDTAKEKPQIGEVMAIGPGKANEQGKIMPIGVKVGQKVLYKKWGGNEDEKIQCHI